MSTFNKIKEYLIRVAKDDEFRTSLEAQTRPEDRAKFLREAGYTFTPDEFDSAASKILELAEQGLFSELDESELSAVVGGQSLGGSHLVYGGPISPNNVNHSNLWDFFKP
jgi:predicted ribosomally synthesized peptide with nif11-like leader